MYSNQFFGGEHDAFLDPTLSPSSSMCYDPDALDDPTAGRPQRLPEAHTARAAIAAARSQCDDRRRVAMAAGDSVAVERWAAVDDMLREAWWAAPLHQSRVAMAREVCVTLLGAEAEAGINWP
jgi:hypothetical protein